VADDPGISLGDGDDYFENTETGTITIGYADYPGITMSSGDDTFLNAGTINIEVAGNPGITMGSGTDYLENTGTINVGVAGCNGISMGCNDTVPNTLVNTGTINVGSAMCWGIRFGQADDALGNSGTISIQSAVDGGIGMESGDDTLTNTGTIVGSVYMGSHDDVVNLGATECASSNTGDIDGGTDAETYGDTINLVGDGSVDGDVLNFEYLNKTGSGVFSLNDCVEVETAADISGGTLLVNGEMAPYTPVPLTPLEVLVHTAGTLGGTGTITGDVVVSSGGTVAPGGSIGTLTIDGNYTHNAGTIALEVDGTSADRLDVTGTADLGDETDVTVTPIGVTENGDSHTVLTAGTLEGDGVPIADPDDPDANTVETLPVLSFEFISDTDSTPHTITMITHRKDYADLVTTENQRSIARNLDDSLHDASGQWEEFLVKLDILPTTAALGDALDEISPEPYANSRGMSRAGINQYRRAIIDRLGDLRGMAWLPDSAKGYASNTLTGSGPALADVPAADEDTWSVWGSGFGQWAEQDGEDDRFGFDYDTAGGVIGVDMALTDTMTIGLSGGMSQTDVEYDEVSSESDIDTWHVGLYAGYASDRFYLDASVSYADNEYETERDISMMDVTAESEHDGEDYAAFLGAGYKMDLGGFKVIPNASVQYIDHQEDSFEETGAGILSLEVDEIDSESIVGAIGVRLARMFELGAVKLLPEVSAQWAHEFGDSEDTVKARFAGSPVTSTFSVKGVDAEADSALLGAALTAYLTDSFSLFVDYQAELRSDFEAHFVSGGLKISF
jgi:outer membrane autotransporter protein